MQDPRTNSVRVSLAVIAICLPKRARAGLLTSETDWALGCLSNQTQAQQIGIHQPLERSPLRFELLEGRHE